MAMALGWPKWRSLVWIGLNYPCVVGDIGAWHGGVAGFGDAVVSEAWRHGT